jgi:probable phosphoglycerate mutase
MPADARPLVLLVRHGETVWNVERRMQGGTDVPLSDVGRAQARALAARLRGAPPVRIVSSDLVRARETADVVAAACGVEVVVEPRLREQHLGAWEGRTFAEVAASDPETAARFRAYDPDARPAGGETRRELAARVAAGFEAHARPDGSSPLLVVSHGGALQTLLYRVLGLPLSTPRRFTLPNTALSTLVWSGGAWHVVTLNDVAHLPADPGETFPFA